MQAKLIRLSLSSVLLLAMHSSAFAELVELGHRPPSFMLQDDLGEMHRVDDHIGSPVILYFTHNMCHYCTQVIRFLKRAHSKYDRQGLVIMTINVWADGAKLIRRYKEAFGLPFLMLAGKDPQLLQDYEVNFVPIIVFVGKDGLVKKIYHHFVLEQDFRDSVDSIMEGAG